MSAARIGDAIQRHDAAPADLTTDISLKLPAAAFKLGLEADHEAARADLTNTAVVKVDIAEAACVAFIANGAAALAYGVPAEATVAVIAVPAPVMGFVDVIVMRMPAGKREAGIAANVHGKGGTGARLCVIGGGRRGDEGGCSQCNGRHSGGHDAVHHGMDIAGRVSNRA